MSETNYNYATAHEDILVYMKYWRAALSLYFAAIMSISAQEVIMPDVNLQRAVRTALKLHPQDSITSDNLQHLEHLKAENLGIINITGLEHATGLTILNLSGNQISDLTPLANLTKLRNLALGENHISDIKPLANLIEMRELHLTTNMVVDVSPLANLMTLRKLHLRLNMVEDVSPLASLTDLVELDIRDNPVLDYSTILDIPYLSYDQYCEVAPLSVWDKVHNRDYPSIGMAWSSGDLNRPGLTPIERITLHDLWIGAGNFDLSEKQTPDGIKLVGNIREAMQLRDEYLSLNPNLIIVKAIAIREVGLHELPADSPLWVRDENGDIVIGWKGTHGFYDFTNPVALNRIMDEVRATGECGLYDGVFFDHWNDGDTALAGYRTLEAEQQARATLMRFIRTELRPNFLVLVNGGGKRVGPMTGPLVNGSFMETGFPADKPQEDMPIRLNTYSNLLHWSQSTMRIPHVNFLEGWGNPHEPANSPTNRRWMRVFTTLSLTHSDGYVLFTNGHQHRHTWYDFWDADLGRPVGGKAQLYQEIEGLYIREFTNGWAVYNNSGEAQVITLPEETQGVASGLAGTEHALANLDGEMYLRAKPKNPADVNGDGVVNILDLTLIAQALGTDNAGVDVNGDGFVNILDLVFVANAF